MRGTPRIALVYLLAGGCAQIAGIDKTSGDGRTEISLSIERVSVGATVTRAPQDLTGHTATYLVADPDDPTVITRVIADNPEPGLWTADLFDVTPPVLFDLPDQPTPIQRLFDFPNPDLQAAFVVFEHPNPTPAPAGTIDVSVTLDRPVAAGEAFQLFTVGAWNQLALPAVAAAGSIATGPLDTTTMTSLTNRPLETITADDAPFVLRHTAGVLDGIFEVPPFDQTGTDTIAGGTMTLVAADQMLDVAIDQAAAMTRFSAVRPAVSAPTFAWSVHAAPGADELVTNLGPTLISGTPAAIDTTIQVSYANPFSTRGWQPVMTLTATGSRTTMPDGVLPVTLSAGLTQHVLSPAAGQMLDFPAALPELISIDGNALSIDNAVQLTAPTAPVEITMVTSKAPTVAILDVFELVPNTDATAFDRSLVLHVATAADHFTVPPETFVAGKRYTLRVRTIADGFPNLATGDLRTTALPQSTAFADSGVFEVVP